jgi:thioredoxin 1
MFKSLAKLNFTCAKRLISTSPQHFNVFKIATAKEFEMKILQSTKPIIVGFFKDGCNPCNMMKPRIESVIKENKGKISLAQVEVIQHKDIADKYEVESVPVLLAMKKGKILDRLNGLHEQDRVRSFVEKIIAKN